MPDEPSGYELQRSIEGLRGDMRNGIAGLNDRLDKLVSVEAHTADLRRVDDRLAELAKDVADEREARLAELAAERDARRAEMASEREARKAAEQRHEAAMQRMVTTQRFIAAAILLPVALFIGNLLLARSGG